MRSSEVADFPRGFFLKAPAIKSSQRDLLLLYQKTKTNILKFNFNLRRWDRSNRKRDMKINYKEFVIIGNAGEEKQVIVLSDIQFDGDKEVYDKIVKTFESEVYMFWKTKANCNDWQMMLREDPYEPAKYVENQKCVVTEFWDSEEVIWKQTVKMVKIVEE